MHRLAARGDRRASRRVRAARVQPRLEPRPRRRRGHRGSRPPARRAALERRHELHAGARRREGAARASPADCRAASPPLRVTRIAPRRPRLAIAGGLLAALTATLVATGALATVDKFAVGAPHAVARGAPSPVGHDRLADAPEPRRLPPPTRRSSCGRTPRRWCRRSSWYSSLPHDWHGRTRSCGAHCGARGTRSSSPEGSRSTSRRSTTTTFTISAFDTSLPSGHTIRSLIVAGAVAAAWRSGRAAYVWAATVPFALVATGAHTPTDVVAGSLIAVALAGWAPQAANVRAA